jgi:hypothetical protein
MPFLASVVPHATQSKPPPTAAVALGPAFTVQVQTTLSLANISTSPISFDIEDILVGEESQLEKDVSWKNHVPSEALIIQLLKSYIHSELQTMMPSVYMTIRFETDMDVPMSLFIQDPTLNIKQTGKVLRPLPWPSTQKRYTRWSHVQIRGSMARETSAAVAPTFMAPTTTPAENTPFPCY